MVLTVPIIYISVLVVASFSLCLVFKYGIKKKSYEEALAEHRKHTNALLGTKPKLKEKKIKKAAKKLNKDKSGPDANIEEEAAEENDTVESSNELDKTDKPKEKKEKISQKDKPSPKQITTHVEFKEKPEEFPEVPIEKEITEVIIKKCVKKGKSILINKDQKEATNLSTNLSPLGINHFDVIHPKDELEMLHPNTKVDSRKTDSPIEEKKSERPVGNKKNKQKQENEKTVAGPTAIPTEPVEKTKEEIIVSSMVSASQEPVPNAGKEKKKKKSDFHTKQQLTAERDNLIYALRNAELSRSEVQLLIDLLLNKQLEAPAVIDEWTEGKSDPVQKLKKQLAEKEKLLAEEQEVLVGVQTKLKEVRSEQLAERAQMQQKLRAAEEGKIELIANHNRLQQKIQELEDFRKKEAVQVQRLIEENKTLHMQYDTICKEREIILHLKAENGSLTTDLQRLQQELQEHVRNYQACVLEIQSLQEELVRTESNHTYALAAAVEKEQRLLENARKEEQRLRDIIDKLEMEKTIQANGSADVSKAHEVQLLNLTNELTSVKSELSSTTEKFHEAERQYQTELKTSADNYAKLKMELSEQLNKNNELRRKNWKVMEALNAAEIRNKATAVPDIDKLTCEIKLKEEDAQKQFLQRLFPTLEDLKAVSAQTWQQEYERVITDYLKELQDKPAVTISCQDQNEEVARLKAQILHYKSVIDDAEGTLNSLQMNVEKEEIQWRNKLAEKDAELQELRNKFVEQQGNECVSPDVNGIKFAYKCIEQSLPVIIEELQNKVTQLDNQLEQEKLDKQKLISEKQTSKHTNKMFPVDSTSTIEKLSEELDRAREQLRLEQTKNAVYQNGKSS
ncbi:hypothetical protein GWI33_019221 [Rhynchophorus ferrugineus]|uniref:Kinectin n=1 Tax=Rhynchophorus ferrugineus TaxID=354439 RepID=A0A834I5S2_RHYFE|nr:hypothetical protein GWI33_019221 [Rhynchophorus ferrugineus]